MVWETYSDPDSNKTTTNRFEDDLGVNVYWVNVNVYWVLDDIREFCYSVRFNELLQIVRIFIIKRNP